MARGPRSFAPRHEPDTCRTRGVMQLLVDNPLWIVLILITIALHVGFAVAVRRLMRDPGPKPPPGG